MKYRLYKQVVELGHFIPYEPRYWERWAVDTVIDEPEKVVEYLTEADKETTSFFRGVYYSKNCGHFAISYYPLNEEGA